MAYRMFFSSFLLYILEQPKSKPQQQPYTSHNFTKYIQTNEVQSGFLFAFLFPSLLINQLIFSFTFFISNTTMYMLLLNPIRLGLLLLDITFILIIYFKL